MLVTGSSRSARAVSFRMSQHLPISRVINLIPDESQRLWTVGESEARRRLLAGESDAVLELDGSFALVAQDGERVVLARSLDRPMRYFLAKASRRAGADRRRADRRDRSGARDAADGQRSSTRATRAWCPRTTSRRCGWSAAPIPNPVHRRFFDPPRGMLPHGSRRHRPPLHRGACTASCAAGSPRRTARAPIGVPFSGGIDSGAVLLCLYKLLLNEGQSPARLKAFTLSVDGEGEDARQAREFLRRTDLEMLGEIIDVAVERARSAARRRGDRGLQAARRRMRRGEPRAARRRFASAIRTGACSSTATAATRTSRIIRSRRTAS